MHDISTLDDSSRFGAATTAWPLHHAALAEARRPDGPCLPASVAAPAACASTFLTGANTEIELKFEAAERILWCYMQPRDALCFTPSMMRELNAVHRAISAAPAHARPRYCVVGSRLPGIFNLGGDLAHVMACVKAGDKAALTAYAHACVAAIHACSTGFAAQVISVGLVQGNALGGGFESALCFNTLVAERSVKMGFPEVLFGLFPGMGAYHFLTRKLGALAAHKMIADGRIYSAGDLFDMGLIDILCADGAGEAAVRAHVAQTSRRHGQTVAMNRVRESVNPISLAQLTAATDIWVETAMQIDATDLRRIQRLVSAQSRHRTGALTTPAAHPAMA